MASKAYKQYEQQQALDYITSGQADADDEFYRSRVRKTKNRKQKKVS